MKTGKQIRVRIETLHEMLIAMRHRKNKGGLIYESAIVKVQGEIFGLEWVLGIARDPTPEQIERDRACSTVLRPLTAKQLALMACTCTDARHCPQHSKIPRVAGRGKAVGRSQGPE